MDWITLLVEAVGIAIFVVWAIVPIGEFRVIHRRIKAREADATEQVGAVGGVSERIGRDA